MKKKSVVILLCIVYLAAVYFLLAFYYKNRIAAGTFVNDVYIGGMTLEQANEALVDHYNGFTFEITKADGEVYSFTSDDIDAKAYYGQGMQSYLNSTGLVWPVDLFMKKPHPVSPEISFNSELVSQKIQELFQDEFSIPAEVALTNTEEGYVLTDGKRNRLDYYMILEQVCKQLKDGVYKLDLASETGQKLFTNQDYSLAEVGYMNCFYMLEKYKDYRQVIYFGDDCEVIDYKMLGDLSVKDADGLPTFDRQEKICLDKAKVREYAEQLISKYSTLDSHRVFKAQNGNTIELLPGNYGNVVNAEALKEFITGNIGKTDAMEYVAEYTSSFIKGLNDIGPDYVEVSITDQHLYLVKNNECVLDTDIVSGDMNLNRDTIEGVYYISEKAQNVTLKGNGYSSHVDYWMPIFGSYGIHDASWRDTFGGDEYLENGSHGCINVPSDVMGEIFDACYVNMPVIIYNEI